MRISVALLTAAALSFSAYAQTPSARVAFEGSTDNGLTWTGGTILYTPGPPVLVRMRVSLANAGTTTVLGVAGCTLQPKLTSWTAGDIRVPFSNGGITGVTEEPQTNLGRINPFASSGMGTGSASGLLTSFVDGGNTLRFAGANCITPTTNLAWGVSLGQVPQSIGGTSFRTGTDVVMFRYGVVLNAPAGHVYQATVDPATILAGRASWYRTPAGTGSLLAPAGEIVPLNIEIIPSPGILALLGFAAFVPHRWRARSR